MLPLFVVIVIVTAKNILEFEPGNTNKQKRYSAVLRLGIA